MNFPYFVTIDNGSSWNDFEIKEITQKGTNIPYKVYMNGSEKGIIKIDGILFKLFIRDVHGDFIFVESMMGLDALINEFLLHHEYYTCEYNLKTFKEKQNERKNDSH